MSDQGKHIKSKFISKRQSKLRQLQAARTKRWSTDTKTTSDAPITEQNAPESSISQLSAELDEEIPQSSTELKFQKHKELKESESLTGEIDDHATGKSNFLIIDVTVLTDLIKNICCPECSKRNLQIIEGANYGLASELVLKCFSCNATISSCTSSRKVQDYHSSFEVTKRVVTAMVDIGAGYAGLEKFCATMGMKSLHHKTFVKHSKTICKSAATVATDSLQLAAKIVRETYSESFKTDRNDIIDISVSYDGSWMKRGHTSNFGVGVVVDLITGLVLDYQVMSKYCHSCALLTTEFKNSDEYEKWKEMHTCDKNFDGSSGSMEVEAALLIWKRSIEKHGFRYTTLLSDGDSKTYVKLSESNIYGDDHKITKEECVNHVAKRMGTALRKVSSECRSKGITLGGRGRGKLTQNTIDKLTLYYQKAIHNNLSDTDKMRNAIYATLFHAVSTDDSPHHKFCPSGNDSWCFFNRALACGTQPGQHEAMVRTPLSKEIAEQLLPVYRRLSEEELLKRCQRGKTQNANESLHALIWSKCPKTSFLHKNRVEGGVALAVSQFNRGRQGVAETLKNLGISPGITTIAELNKKDEKRQSISRKRSAEKFKKMKKAKKLAKLQAEESAIQEEGGPSYATGEF